jgi:hypothetical protein
MPPDRFWVNPASSRTASHVGHSDAHNSRGVK